MPTKHGSSYNLAIKYHPLRNIPKEIHDQINGTIFVTLHPKHQPGHLQTRAYVSSQRAPDKILRDRVASGLSKKDEA
jgi:hypothetical protein